MIISKLTKVSLLLLTLCCGRSLIQIPAIGAAEQVKPKVELLWADLLTANETKVVATVLALAETPRETVAFLKENLCPVTINPNRVDKLITDLDSSDAAVSQKAEEHLEYLGKYVRPSLHKARAAVPSLQLAKRIDDLLKRLPYDPMDKAEDLFAELKRDPKNNTVRGNLITVLKGSLTPTQGPPSPSWLRAKRAIVVLEHIATPEALDLLKVLAAGEPEALPTKEAKAALDRLANPTTNKS